MSRSLQPILLILLLAPYFCAADHVLQQVHVITRHGARTQLAKDADTLLEEAGATLTPLGVSQHYELGVWLREVYNTEALLLDTYDSSIVRLESSALDRTLSSANSLSLGLFPYEAQVGDHGEELFQGLVPELPSIPVYSREASNDRFLRAYYNICPAYTAKLPSLYESNEWKVLEEQSQNVLYELGSLFPDEDDTEEIEEGTVGLKYVWTYYDRVKVAYDECSLDPTAYSCTSLGDEAATLAAAVTEAQLKQFAEVMGASEQLKFSTTIAGNLLGSPLLWRMLDRAETLDGKFFLYSAHAPTMLSLLATLNTTLPSDEPFPDYASAIIMEVYQDEDDSSDKSIRFLYKMAANTTATYLPMQEECEGVYDSNAAPATVGFGEDTMHCSLAEFLAWSKKNTLTTDTAWCNACENESTDVCLLIALDATTSGSSQEEELLDDDRETSLFVGTFFGGLVIGMVVMGCLMRCVRPRAEYSSKEQHIEHHPAEDASVVELN